MATDYWKRRWLRSAFTNYTLWAVLLFLFASVDIEWLEPSYTRGIVLIIIACIELIIGMMAFVLWLGDA